MRTNKRILPRLFSLALVFLLALTAAVPVFAANTPANTENLKITIHNNKGLPEMTESQFNVYQLFSGTPNRDSIPSGADWDASEWNNWSLADIQWGASIKEKDAQDALITALKALVPANTAWLDAAASNPFKKVSTAADLAAVLENNKENKFMQGFADFLMKGKEGGNSFLTALEITGTVDKKNTETTDDDILTYDLTGQGTGYYIFQDTNNPKDVTAVSEYIVAVMGTQDIDMKASIPTVDKQIVGGANGTTEGDVAGVSDYVQFKLIGTLPKNFADFETYEYIFHDTLSAGLTYVNNDKDHPLTVHVYADKTAMEADTALSQGTVPEANYTVSEKGSETEAPICNLEVKFDDLMKITPEPTAASYIVVTYYARVNENAVIGSEGNPNEVYLEYSNDPHDEGTGKTKEEKVYVYAFGLDLTKIGSDTAHGEGNGLPGAGFVLSKKDTAGNTYYAKFADKEDGSKVLTGWVKQSATEPASEGEFNVDKLIQDYKDAKKALVETKEAEKTNAADTLAKAKDALKDYLLESGVKGEIPDITGLDEGDYTLKEVIVPDGYNSMDDFELRIEADINTDGTLQKVVYTHGGKTTTYLGTEGAYDAAEYVGETVPADERAGRVKHFESGLLPDTIVNQKAPLLPFTGGIGTLIFYVLGIALIAGAVTYLVISSKKRKKAE